MEILKTVILILFILLFMVSVTKTMPCLTLTIASAIFRAFETISANLIIKLLYAEIISKKSALALLDKIDILACKLNEKIDEYNNSI
ncbi:MAG: hypothetical protein LBC07_05175 [Elusimicrobiota bacterium]|nr:hypothetical protein [Elusimicrobiota bacterium]